MPRLGGLDGPAGIFRVITLVIGFIALVLAAASLAPNDGNIYAKETAEETKNRIEVRPEYVYWHVINPRKYMALCTDFTIAVIHLSIVITTFVASLAGLVLSMCGGSDPESSKKLCMIYHLIGGFLLIVGGAGWLIGYIAFPPAVVAVKDEEDGRSLRGGVGCGRKNYEHFKVETGIAGFENVVTAVFGILDGVVYIVTGIFMWTSRPKSDPDQGSSPMEQAMEPTNNNSTNESFDPNPENTMAEEAASA